MPQKTTPTLKPHRLHMDLLDYSVVVSLWRGKWWICQAVAIL